MPQSGSKPGAAEALNVSPLFWEVRQALMTVEIDTFSAREVVARDSHTASIVGFAYGYTSAPGQWWHDIVAAALEPQIAKE